MSNQTSMVTWPTKADFGQRFAIMVGTFSGGVSIKTLKMGEDAADRAVAALLADGFFAKAVPISWPCDIDADHDLPWGMTNGTTYVALAAEGVGAGFDLYGPFFSEDALEEFGEEHRPEDGEWTRFEDASGTLMSTLLADTGAFSPVFYTS